MAVLSAKWTWISLFMANHSTLQKTALKIASDHGINTTVPKAEEEQGDSSQKSSKLTSSSWTVQHSAVVWDWVLRHGYHWPDKVRCFFSGHTQILLHFPFLKHTANPKAISTTFSFHRLLCYRIPTGDNLLQCIKYRCQLASYKSKDVGYLPKTGRSRNKHPFGTKWMIYYSWSFPEGSWLFSPFTWREMNFRQRT